MAAVSYPVRSFKVAVVDGARMVGFDSSVQAEDDLGNLAPVSTFLFGIK